MKRIITKIAPIIALLFLAVSLKAEGTKQKEKFNPGEMILHHISDEHEITIIGDFGFSLPIILITHDGFHVFSSAHLYDNPQTATYTDTAGNTKEIKYYAYNQFVMQHEHIYLKQQSGNPIAFDSKGKVLNKPVTIDLSITKNVIGIFIVTLITLWLFLSVAKAYKKREGKEPKGMQSLVEPIILFVRDEIARPSIGPEADRFVPFLLSLFFFIWIGNMVGVIPFLGGVNITGTMSITAVLALFVFVITMINTRKVYWTHILAPPNVPFVIKYLILVPIEILNIFTKPFILMVRLTANMLSGHITMLALAAIIFIFGIADHTVGYSIGIGTTAFTVFMDVIELLIDFLQAYVFTILAALYFGMAVEKAHH